MTETEKMGVILVGDSGQPQQIDSFPDFLEGLNAGNKLAASGVVPHMLLYLEPGSFFAGLTAGFRQAATRSETRKTGNG